MPTQKNMTALLLENKTLFVVLAVLLVLIELEIFAVAAVKSGRKSWLQVVDGRGAVIHETDGNNLSQFNKYYFEKTFGPLEQYSFKLVTKDIPFPFRAWFTAAIGIPVGVILLFSFIVKTFQSLFFGAISPTRAAEPQQPEGAHRLQKVIDALSRFNIFTIGFLVFLAVFGYWVIPNLIVYLGRTGIETLTRYKWIFLCAALVCLGLMVWIIYLKYLLALKTIEGQTAVDKYRLQLEYEHGRRPRPQLAYDQQNRTQRPPLDWPAQSGAGRGELND